MRGLSLCMTWMPSLRATWLPLLPEIRDVWQHEAHGKCCLVMLQASGLQCVVGHHAAHKQGHCKCMHGEVPSACQVAVTMTVSPLKIPRGGSCLREDSALVLDTEHTLKPSHYACRIAAASAAVS